MSYESDCDGGERVALREECDRLRDLLREAREWVKRLTPKDFKLGDGRWLRYKGRGAVVLPGGPDYAENAKWKHPEGLLVIATVEEQDGRANLHVSLSHRSREVTDKDCTLVADALFPVGAVVERRGEVAEFADGEGHSYAGVVHLMTPVHTAAADKIPQAMRQALGKMIASFLGSKGSKG